MRRWRLSVAAAIALGIFILEWSLQRDPPVSPREAARELRRESLRENTDLSDIECARDAGLPRSFLCFGEGENDLHLGLRVRIGQDGSLHVSALH